MSIYVLEKDKECVHLISANRTADHKCPGLDQTAAHRPQTRFKYFYCHLIAEPCSNIITKVFKNSPSSQIQIRKDQRFRDAQIHVFDGLTVHLYNSRRMLSFRFLLLATNLTQSLLFTPVRLCTLSKPWRWKYSGVRKTKLRYEPNIPARRR